MTAAFVALGVVFTLGLLLMAFLKTDVAERSISLIRKGGVGKAKAPVKKQKPAKKTAAESKKKPRRLLGHEKAGVVEMTSANVPAALDAMRTGDKIGFTFYSHSCPWCHRFRKETLAAMVADGSLPLPVRVVEATSRTRQHSQTHPVFAAFAPHVRGLPTTVIVMRRADGHYFHPVVGFLTKAAFQRKVDEAGEAAVKVKV